MVIFPWPSRQLRQEAISNARREKEQSQSAAAQAAIIQRDIERIAEHNHFAASIAEQIMRHHRGRGQP